MTKKSVKIIDNKDGSASALIEVGSTYDNLAKGSIEESQQSYASISFPTAYCNPLPICGGREGEAKRRIIKTIFYWENEPIVYKCISLVAQLSNDTFTISCEDKKVEDLLRKWWRDIKGDDFLNYFFLEYFRSGNVPILRTNIKYVPRNGYNTNKTIPGGYTVLNPLNISIKDSPIPGIKQAYLSVSQDFLSIIKNSGMMDTVRNLFPEEISSQIKPGAGEILLPKEIFSMVTKDKQPYESWAIPLVSRAFDALDQKRNLMEMDRTTTSGVRNRILKVTIGNDKYPVTDTKELSVLASKFRNPSKNLTIFWNHTLNMEYIEPKLDSLNSEKYEPVLDDIRSVFGISKVLLGIEGDSDGNNTLCLKGMIEILEQARNSFITWFIREVNDVARIFANVKNDIVSVSFGTLNLKDENDFFRVIMQMVDRQIISYETAMETLGYYFPKEINRLEKEKKIREEKGVLVAQKAPTQGGGGVTGVDTQDTGGRPNGGDKETERKNSKNKPKTPSGINSLGSIINDSILSIASGIDEENIKEMAIRSVSSLDIEDGKKNFIIEIIKNSTEFCDYNRASVFLNNILKYIN